MTASTHRSVAAADAPRGPSSATVVPFPTAETLIVTDLDDTLLPARVSSSERTRHQADLRDLCRYLLAQATVAFVCVTGRRALNARDILAAPAWVAGVHGAELLAPYAREPLPYPAPSAHGPGLRRLAHAIAASDLCPSGMHIEDKGVVLAVHHPHEPADSAARRMTRLITLARASGLVVISGRGWTEFRPPFLPHKGDVVPELVRRWRPRNLVVAGDDYGDLAMFEAAARLEHEGAVEQSVSLAVSSPGVSPECASGADLVLNGPSACRAWFRRYAPSFPAKALRRARRAGADVVPDVRETTEGKGMQTPARSGGTGRRVRLEVHGG